MKGNAMIQDVELNTSPIFPGEVRRMVVRSTGILIIDVKCFIGNPPPPGFKPCPECGKIQAQSGQPVDIVASRQIFSSSSGSLDINITDTSDGDTHNISISVSTATEGSASAATA
jgi:hypothetical protein